MVCNTKIKRHKPLSEAMEIYYERTVLSTWQVKFKFDESSIKHINTFNVRYEG